MKHFVLLLALSVPSASMASAAPLLQEQAHEPGDVSATTMPHHQLFTVKYVLVKAPPDGKDGMPFDFGDGRAAIHPVSLRGDAGVLLRGAFAAPNTYVCHGWACMDGPRR